MTRGEEEGGCGGSRDKLLLRVLSKSSASLCPSPSLDRAPSMSTAPGRVSATDLAAGEGGQGSAQRPTEGVLELCLSCGCCEEAEGKTSWRLYQNLAHMHRQVPVASAGLSSLCPFSYLASVTTCHWPFWGTWTQELLPGGIKGLNLFSRISPESYSWRFEVDLSMVMHLPKLACLINLAPK